MSTSPQFPSAFAPAPLATGLPPRVVQILQGYFASVVGELKPRVGTLLIELERQMVELIENARHLGMQSERIADLHALRKRNGELLPQLLATLESQLSGLRQPRQIAAPVADAPRIDFQVLSLVEDAQMDQEIVLNDIVRRHEARSSMALLLLGQRFGVLAGAPAFELSRIPAGPHSLCHALRDALPALQLSRPSQLLLWHAFDRYVLSEYPRLLDALNLMLESEGVLPGLVFIPRRVRSERAAPRAPSERPQTDWRAPSMPPAWAAPAAQEAPRPQVPTADLLSALQTLQAAPAAERPREPKDIRQVLLERLRKQHGPQSEFTAADADAFALLERLYDELGREVRPNAPATALLAQLQLPLAQAALRDRRFFLRPQHPARGLLDAVAESGARWQNEDEQDPQLPPLLRQAVEHVVNHYQGDEKVFEQANRAVQRHLQAAAHKAELAERRQVEAARGRERLEVARQRAAAIIDGALQGQTLPPARRILLDQAWNDVLTLAQLRQREKSEAWIELLQITLQIVAAATAPAGGEPDPQLSARIEKTLRQVGYHDEEAQAIALRLAGAESDAAPAELLQERARLGGSGAPAQPERPRTPREQECLEHLRTLAHGTWFEIAQEPPQEGVVRRRLSWYSPDGDHALLVNPRGQRTGEQSLDALARLMAQGRARPLAEDRNRPLDRVWQAVLDTMSRLDGEARP